VHFKHWTDVYICVFLLFSQLCYINVYFPLLSYLDGTIRTKSFICHNHFYHSSCWSSYFTLVIVFYAFRISLRLIKLHDPSSHRQHRVRNVFVFVLIETFFPARLLA